MGAFTQGFEKDHASVRETTEILGEAENGQYDLIILGAAGATDAKHNVPGSVSSKVAWQATCSVAVVKLGQ